MSLRRFKTAAPLVAAAFDLEGEEARHLRVVLRARPGERIAVFDGAGGEADAEIVDVGRSAVACRVVSEVRHVAPPAVRVELACALPRAGAADDVVRVAVETGAGAIRPLVAERGVWKPDAGAYARFERAAVAALKQSGRSHMPALLPPAAPRDLAFGDALALVGSTAPDARNVAAALRGRTGVAAVLVIVGPEGGLSAAEEDVLAQRGAMRVRCGRGILRVETAVVALLAHVAAAVE